MRGRGDMFPVTYPPDTGPRHAPLSLDWRPPVDEEMWIADQDYYADARGNLVAPGDPAAQTVVATKGYRYPRSVATAYGIPVDAADANKDAANAPDGTPVMHSGVGVRDDDEDAKSAHQADAVADDDAAGASTQAAKVRHARK